jgi:hypothetical protein
MAKKHDKAHFILNSPGTACRDEAFGEGEPASAKPSLQRTANL